MNVKKAVKKIVALASGLTMIGATIMGATALDLGDYPAPFVQNGQFNGKIVVGASAATADVLGAIDISASLQAEAKTGVSVAGTTATTTVEGGILLEDTSNQDLNWGDYLSASAVDETEFPVLLAEGVLEDDDGTDYDFDQQVVVGNETLAFSLVDKDVYDDPVLYLDLDAATNTGYLLTFTLDFDSGDEVNWENLDDSEALEMFGTVWTIDDIAASGTDDIVLYGSDVTQLVQMNTPVDIEVDGETYTLNIVGANAETSEVHISVNGEVKSMTEGATKTVNGLKVYVQDVFVSTVGGESASANLFVGSKELNLGNAFGSWTVVQLDSEDLDGVEVYMTGSDTAVSQIDFRIDATELENPNTGEDYDWIALGDSFVDPLFGFKVEFVEAVPGFTSSARDYFNMRASSDDLEVKFTNHDGDEYTFYPYTEHATVAGNLTNGEDFVFSQTNAILEDSIFIVHEDATSAEPVTKIYEFTGLTGSSGSKKAAFKDLAVGGSTFEVADGDALGSSTYTVTVDETAEKINLSAATVNYIYTYSGTKVTFEDADSANDATMTVTFNEDEKADNSDEVAGDDYTVAVTYDTTDDEMDVAAPSGWNGGADDDTNSDYAYGVGDYGTYYKHETDDNTELELWFPLEDVDYHVYLAGPGAMTVSAGGSDGSTYYNVNPIGVGIGVLDVDAPAVGSTPMIVVGGPCANTVAAELMGNLANCAEGFEEGKAVIKFYEADNALLVAGYSAMDTQGATRVLANPAKWSKLSGSEVEVLVPSLSGVSINTVA